MPPDAFLIAPVAVRQHDAVRTSLVATGPLAAGARALALIVLLLAARAGAQPTGIISGVVLDATTRVPLPGTLVTARSPALLGSFAIDLSAMTFGMPRALFPVLAVSVGPEQGGEVRVKEMVLTAS